MKNLYTWILLSITVLSANKLKAQVDVNDSLVLVALYDSTNGGYWATHTNWLSKNPVSTWYGVTVLNNRVTAIILYQNNLQGQIPSAIGNLTELQELSLGVSKLSGNIPAEIGNCTKLNTLYLAHNQLSGSIPLSISNCKELVFFQVYDNQLSGSLPSELGTLTRLTSLFVSQNQFSGNIPPEIGNLNNLFLFNCDHNNLSGTIPTTLGNLTGLYELYLNNNQLSGSIPASLGNLTNCEEVYLQHNELSGHIPDKLSKLNVDVLDLSYNQLSGHLDSGLFNNIFYLYLDHNQLSGKLPSAISAFSVLRQLNLSYNELTGTIPAPFIANARYLRSLKLNNNNFNGEIPAVFGNLSHLITLNLSHNNLKGAIPSELGNSHNLRNIVLSFNNLQGAIPGSLHNLHRLRKFDVRGNRLNGKVPTFQNFTTLEELNVLENYFTFDGIEELVPIYASYNSMYYMIKYSPQKHIAIHQNKKTLSVYAGGTLSNNTYKWYKDGVLAKTKHGDSTYVATAAGNYSAAVTNSIATELTLMSDTVSYSTGKVSDAVASSINKNNFSIYPNPAKTYTTVSFSGAGNVVMRLSDASGNLLQTKNITAAQGLNTVTINVSSYSAGLYFITLIDEKKQKQTLQFNKL